MKEYNRIDYSKYRLDTAKENLNDAIILYNNGSFKSSINRSYYAIFHSMRAVLVLDNFDMNKHSGVISKFRQTYIKTEVFNKNLSVIIENLFKYRNNSDYDDFFIATKEDAALQLKNAEEFYNTVSAYLEVRWQNE